MNVYAVCFCHCEVFTSFHDGKLPGNLIGHCPKLDEPVREKTSNLCSYQV